MTKSEIQQEYEARIKSRTSPEMMTVDPAAVCPECKGASKQKPSMWPQGDPKSVPVCLDCYIENHYQ
jgi:hypothetical protein